MPVFQCKIGTSDGRVVEKEFEAGSRELLRESLEEQGFFIFRMKKRPFQFLLGGDLFRSRLTGRKFLSFNQELIVLIRSGLPILQVLDTLIERMEPGGLLDVLREIRQDIKGGTSLSEAFGKFPRYFPHLFVASVKAGERTGDLPITLTRFIEYQKRIEAIKGKVKSASFYPILLSIAVAAVLLFLMLWVIPTFTQVFAGAHVQLPLITRILIATAQGLVKGLPVLVPLALAASAAITLFIRSERGGFFMDRVKLHLPFFGKLAVDYSLTGFCRTFGTTLSSGIPVIQSMQMSRGTLNNRVLEISLNRAIQRVEEGVSLASALEQTGFFPVIALRMIGVGETTGALADMLSDVSEYYEAEVERRLERLTTLIEPMMMLSMGLLIGGIVVAMYIPIFQLAGAVSQ
ncbi:MAG: type II secretion system F family protein [Desulfuromonadales bacterium]|jgi:type IV pilus assembly protein PilC